MKEKTKLAFLVIIGIILSLLAIYLGINWQQVSLSRRLETRGPIPKLPLSQKRIATALISFNPSELTIYQNGELKIGVLLESREKIVGADLHFKFEPAFLEVTKIRPGNFFSDPQEIKKTIDTQKGEIFYSLGSFSSQEGKGVLVELTFKAKNPGTTEVSLIGETQIAAKEIDEVKINLPVLGKYVILK